MLRPRRGGSAKSTLLTVLGEFVLPAGGSVWTGTMIDTLESLAIGSGNVRQVLSRLRDDGLIEAERHGRQSRWHLTDRGHQLLEVGADRIYRFGQRGATWDGQWLLIQCPVPEVQRRQRRSLQTRLSFEGFGFISPTVAVSPHVELEGRANQVLIELGLDDRALVMSGRTGSLSPDETILAEAWDLDELRVDYGQFVAEFEASKPTEPSTTFAELVKMVDAWRQFPFRDPEVPLQLLDEDWIGLRARELFNDRRANWAPVAATYFGEREATYDS